MLERMLTAAEKDEASYQEEDAATGKPYLHGSADNQTRTDLPDTCSWGGPQGGRAALVLRNLMLCLGRLLFHLLELRGE